MILPNTTCFKDYSFYPLTLCLLLLNVLIFMVFFSGQQNSVTEKSLTSNSLMTEDQLILSGRLYRQYLQKLSEKNLQAKPEWIRLIRVDNLEQLGLLGAYALRDADFLNSAESMSFWGDQVQIIVWKKEVHEFINEYQKQLMYIFGLSSFGKKPIAWFTYQFSHSTWLHLISNMMFLLVIGSAVEALAGSFILMFLYIVGGFFGGWAFLLHEGSINIPMVGASASISALLAFYCVAETRKRIRYFYFISPLADHIGHIYLPTLLIIPLFLLVDIASFWSSPQGLNGSVAYAAHLGGSAFGLLFGIGYRLLK